jgi:hypothetical protein
MLINRNFFLSKRLGRVLCHPIDTCKAKLQTTDSTTFKGIFDVINTTLRKEGLKGLYKGLGAVVVGGTV